jgi:hypothetical protein
MKQVEGSNQIPCEQFGITNPAQFHSPNSIFVRDANGNIPIDEKGNKVFSFNKLKERNENMALINKFISYVMDNTSKKELDNIVKYISPIVGEALGVENSSKLKLVTYGVKDISVIFKLRKIMGDFAKANNLSKFDFDSFIDQFKIDEKYNLKIEKVKTVAHKVDSVLMEPISIITPYEYSNSQLPKQKSKVKVNGDNDQGYFSTPLETETYKKMITADNNVYNDNSNKIKQKNINATKEPTNIRKHSRYL